VGAAQTFIQLLINRPEFVPGKAAPIGCVAASAAVLHAMNIEITAAKKAAGLRAVLIFEFLLPQADRAES
jgi:hypothetical protein